MKPQRREFLQTLAAGAAVLGLPGTGFGQPGPPITKLADAITLISGVGNNIVALKSDSGYLLVDCGDALHGQAILGLAVGKVSTVFNTHWHPESTGGNDAMAAAGAKLISHVSTQLWMTQEIIHDWADWGNKPGWEKKVYAPRAKAALPTETFYTTGKMTFGGEPIEYGLLQNAHTDGDIFVHFMNANVLVVGDAVQPGRFPYLDYQTGGWIGGMQTAQRTILARTNDATKIVPAVGPVMTKAEVQAGLDLLTKVREELVKLMKQGKGAQDMIDAQAMKQFEGQLTGDPAQFLFTAYRGMWAHVRELGGIV
ncbi:MAG: MBL fold metallo-hydrolase [Acidobacteriota bacterium]